tara:strand:+ start:6293 stop:6475 length:183 start_codon:yes stop_codon:yes gene_type:complete
MTRNEFEQYVKDLGLNPKLEKKYWVIYEKINEAGSPLNFNQKANILLGELRKMNKTINSK